MEGKIKRLSALFVGLLLIGICFVAIRISDVRARKESEMVPGMELMDYYTTQAEEEAILLGHHMQIELPEGITPESIIINNDSLTRLITITIQDLGQNYFYEHPLMGSSDHIDNLFLGNLGDNCVIEVTTNEVYEVEYSLENKWLCLDFIPPRDLYEKVIVVDAGHGGGQPGAIKQGIQEKDLNLAILLELKALLDTHPEWKVYYTRTDDSDVSLDQRVQLANRAHANLFLSIHNNSTNDGRMSDYNGTEVMYDEKKPEEPLGTWHFAQIMVEETVAATGSRNLGITNGNSIYIIRTSQVPVALVEVGFMTNMEELEKLNSEEYQKTVAQGLYNGILRAWEEGF